tara:strand:+ start:546 stop:1628 length:1083 start_codon:yes stop_codon:yes gene_type:complete
MGNIVSRAYGKEYRENIVDSLLTFDSAQTWTTTAGLGSGALDNNESYTGASCLKLLNTRPVTDTTITNSVQSTIIPFTGNYWLTLRIKKDEIDEILTVEMKTFVGATEFNTQTFALGSETAADDLLVNDKWMPFMANIPFNFTKSDNVTFTFTLKGKAGTTLPNTTVRIDGVKLEQYNTENVMPSAYSPTTNEVGKESFGVYDYADLATQTTPIPLTLAGTKYELTNDGIGDGDIAYKLTGLEDIWLSGTSRLDFTGGNVLVLGDTVDIRFDIEYTTSSVNTDISLELEMGIGGTPFTRSIISSQPKKDVGTYQSVVWYSVFLRDLNTLNNPARILASADKTGVTVKVNEWYIRPMKRLV